MKLLYFLQSKEQKEQQKGREDNRMIIYNYPDTEIAIICILILTVCLLWKLKKGR